MVNKKSRRTVFTRKKTHKNVSNEQNALHQETPLVLDGNVLTDNNVSVTPPDLLDTSEVYLDSSELSEGLNTLDENLLDSTLVSVSNGDAQILFGKNDLEPDPSPQTFHQNLTQDYGGDHAYSAVWSTDDAQTIQEQVLEPLRSQSTEDQRDSINVSESGSNILRTADHHGDHTYSAVWSTDAAQTIQEQVLEPLHSQSTEDQRDSINVSESGSNILPTADHQDDHTYSAVWSTDAAQTIQEQVWEPALLANSNSKDQTINESMTVEILPKYSSTQAHQTDHSNATVLSFDPVESIPEHLVEDIPLNFSNSKLETEQDILTENGPTQVISPEGSCDVLTKFKEVADHLKGQLPPLWHAIVENNSLNILKFAPGAALLPQRSIAIGREGKIQYFAHGQLLKQDHELYSFKRSLNIDSVSNMLSSIKDLVTNFRLQEICCGVPNVKFRKFWKSTADSTVDNNIFGETRYQETCRSTSCSLLINQSRRMCLKCLQVSKNLSHREKATAGRATGTPSKYKPYKALITPEKDARDKKKSKIIRNVRKQNSRLRQRYDKLIEDEGIEVGAETDTDLKIILNAAVADPKTTAMQKIFMEQQLLACSLENRKSMKWHPMMIRLALRIRMLSRTAYNELRESGFIVLPSDRTLYDYSHVIDVKEGLCLPIIQDVAETVKSQKHGYQSFHTLMFDEVYIKEKLVQNKHTGEIIGYAHVTEIQQEFDELERMIKATAEGTQVDEPKGPPVAKRILSYLVKGTASGVSSVVASYAVSSLTKEDLMEYTWEVVEALEAHNIKVACFVADGSAVNRGFFDMHPQADEEEGDEEMIEECDLGPSEVVHCTVNVYAPDRNIYFFSDLPHLVKTMRNCLYNSGEKKSRSLFKNGEYMTWSTIVGIFNEKKDQTLKKLHNLTAPCVFLNSYSRMNCLYAFRVFSGSLSNCILSRNVPGTKELGIFEEN